MDSKLRKSKGRFDYKSYVLIRYLKITLPMMASIFLFWLYPLTLSGPVAYDVSIHAIEGCYQNWTQNILFLTNYYVTIPKPLIVRIDLIVLTLI